MYAPRSYTDLLVHIVWATKKRAPLIDRAMDEPLAELFRRKAAEYGAEFLAAGCSFDHVHVAARYRPTTVLSELVKGLKGATSRILNRAAGTASPLYWQDGYWAESFGPEGLPAVTADVRQQRAHHEGTSGPEPWELRLFPNKVRAVEGVTSE